MRSDDPAVVFADLMKCNNDELKSSIINNRFKPLDEFSQSHWEPIQRIYQAQGYRITQEQAEESAGLLWEYMKRLGL
jgi:hypothetical protein